MAVQVAVFADEPSFWRNGDIDIFATYKGAPHARDRLIRNCHLYCAGISERYEHSDENNLIYKFTIDQKREAANQKTSIIYITYVTLRIYIASGRRDSSKELGLVRSLFARQTDLR